jgi:hypothetical protein
MTAARTLTASEREWLHVRSYLQQHRYELAVQAAGDYPGKRVAGTPLLAAQAWLPAAPVPIRGIGLRLDTDAGAVIPERLTAAAASVLPVRADGTAYATYSDAMRELAAPSVFDNRPTYRLTDADLTQPEPRLSFTLGRYFDGIDTGEAAAHEYAARRLGATLQGIREAVGDPCDLRRRPVNLAISTLTLRVDRAADRAGFLLHWRDPAKVGHAGGLYQVIPVGVFQPSGEASWNQRNDFSLWRCIIREFAEELCGHAEDYGSEHAPIDYEAWPLARQMTAALDSGQIRAWCVGIGTDPLTYATDLLAVLVIDSGLAGQLYGTGPVYNSEGRVLASREFSREAVEHAVTREPMQAAGAALLRLAWSHRVTLTA